MFRAVDATECNQMNTTPISLLERLRQPKQEEAWARFVELYTPLIYHWARLIGLQPQDAADLVQEVFVVLIEKLPQFHYDPTKSFRGWLRKVTLNKWREMQRGRSGPLAGADSARLAELASPDPAEQFWETDYRRHLAARAMELMQSDFQPTTWKACWEVVVSGRSATDVAAELGISRGAVYAAKFRVLTRLRQELDGMLD